MASTSNPSTMAVLMAGCALIIASLAFSRMSGNDTMTDVDEEDDEEFITEDDVARIFDALFLQMQSVLSQLMQQIQQLQMVGQRIPESQLKGLIKAEMERALVAKQKMILEQHAIDYDCLEEATWEFLEKEDEYPRVKKAVERFQKLWENATGDEVVGWRPGKDTTRLPTELLTPSRTIDVAEQYFSALTSNMRAIVKKYKDEGKDLKNPVIQQELNMDFAKTANDAGEATLQAQGVSMNQFESSVKAHSSNPTVGRSLAMLQMKQQQELLALQE